MKKGVFLMLLMSVAMLYASTAWAQAFTLPEGQLIGRFGAKYFNSFHIIDDEGAVTRGPSNLNYRDLAGIANMRIGVTDNFELGILVPARYQYLSNDFDETTSYALGDINVDTIFKVAGGSRAALALAGGVKLPFFYRSDADLPPGDGQLDAEARLLSAVRFSFFTIDLGGGYRYRDGDPADVWLYQGRLGFVYSIVFGGVGLVGEASARNGGEHAEWNDYYHGPDYALGRVDTEIGVMFTDHLGASLTTQYTAYGRNVAYGTAYLLSLVYSF